MAEHRLLLLVLWVIALLPACTPEAVDVRSIRTTAECGRDAGGNPTEHVICASASCTICNATVPDRSFPATNAVDGDESTHWASPPLAAGEEFQRVNVTITLERPIVLTSIVIHSGPSLLPASWVLHTSTEGEEFVPVLYFIPSPAECPFLSPRSGMGSGINPELESGSGMGSGLLGTVCVLAPTGTEATIRIPLPPDLETDIQVTFDLRLELLIPRATDDPSNSSQLFYSISELQVFGDCPPITEPEQCTAPDTVRQVRIAPLPEPEGQLLWQQDSAALVPSYLGAWYLDNLTEIFSSSETECPGTYAEDLCRLEDDFSGNSSLVSVGGEVQQPPCGFGEALYFDQPGPREAISLPRNFREVRFELGFIVYPDICLQGSEVPPVELRFCVEEEDGEEVCRLLALISSSECGYCVDQLSTELAILREIINVTLPEGSIVINETRLEEFSALFMDLQATVAHQEGSLLTIAVAVGTISEVPPDFSPPPSVIRIDLELTPALLEKLDQLRTAVEELAEILPDASNTAILVARTEMLVNQAYDNATALERAFEGLLSNLSSLTEQLLVAINETREARLATNQILTLILSRLYQEITAAVTDIASRANQTVTESEQFLQQAQENSDLAGEIGAGFDRSDPLLREVIRLAQGAVDQARVAREVNVPEVLTTITRIELLLSMAVAQNDSVSMVLEEIGLLLEGTELLLEQTEGLVENISTYQSLLQALLNDLSLNVTLYRQQLSPYRIPPTCVIPPCTPGSIHAEELDRNASLIRDSSEPTLSIAEDFLFLLNATGQPFNFSFLNQTAFRAQNLSNAALLMLSPVDTSLLLSEARTVLFDSQSLRNQSRDTLTQAQDVSDRADVAQARYLNLNSDLQTLENTTRGVAFRTEQLMTRTNLSVEARILKAMADNSSAVIAVAEERVRRVEDGSEELAETIRETRRLISDASSALDDTESRFASIRTFLNETRVTARRLTINITEFIAENGRIINEIDSLIAGLEDIHSSVNRINSPVRMATPEGEARAFLSLQPPPGRSISDTIQFESLHLFLWPSALYNVPTLLFYAGPVDFSSNGGTSPVTVPEEDYFTITAEVAGIHLQWMMGGESGTLILDNTEIQGDSQIFVTRVGSQFQLQFGPGPLGSPMVETEVRNNSLLFRTSNRTAFLLGGWPEGAQLGLPPTSLPISTYNPFQGQFQLLLFNGQQWGLWNIRSSSRTDFIGDSEFQRNDLVEVSVWHADRTLASSARTLSFNGNGYLHVESFGSSDTMFTANSRSIVTTVRPNDASEGLVMYAYDATQQLSMEVALFNGAMRLIIRRHDLEGFLVNTTIQPTPADILAEEMELDVDFVQTFGYRVNNDNNLIFQPAGRRFFNNLSRVKAWFGGVRTDLLESPFTPQLTNSSYHGCIDIVLFEGSTQQEVLTGSHFNQFYLNSPLQKGFSATCLTTVYAQEVGLEGRGFLAYDSFQLVEIPNAPIGGAVSGQSQVVISLAFHPVVTSGIIFAALDRSREQTSWVYAVLDGGVLRVRMRGEGESVTLESEEEVTVGEWHYLLLELRLQLPTTEPGDAMAILYLDSLLQSQADVPQFSFQLRTQVPTGEPDDAVLFVGGIDTGVIADIDTLPPFTGCLKDFAYNFDAMGFLNPTLPMDRRYPPGVTYYSCPFLNVSRDPLIPVKEVPPEQRTCLETPPLELEGTHGGFHWQTHLFSSNVLGLLQRTWNLSLSLKYTEDGHVVTVESTQGHSLSLRISGGRAVLSLSSPEGSEANTTSGPLQTNIFTIMLLGCEVDSISQTLSCSLTVGETLAPGSPLTVPYNESSFVPAIPVVFGMKNTSEGSVLDGFVGCISDLAINGDPSGFIGVQTRIPCYNNTELGIGLTGLSRLTLPVEEEEEFSMTFTFKALMQNGLILMVTHSGMEPGLAVGIFNGQLRASNFETFITLDPPSTVCDSENVQEFTLELTFNQTSATLVVNGGATHQLMLPLPVNTSNAELVIGNTPAGFVVEPGSSLFSFLLSEDVDQDSLPSGFVGCVKDNMPRAFLQLFSSENVLAGFCPLGG